MKRMINKKTIFVLLILVIAFTIIVYRKTGVDLEEISIRNYSENPMVHYIIDGQSYDVPLRYHFDKTRLGTYWPTPKSEYLKTTEFSIQTIFPSFSGYDVLFKDQFDAKNKNYSLLRILVRSNKNYKKTIETIINDKTMVNDVIKPKDNEKILEAPNTIHYIFKNASNNQNNWDDVFTANISNGNDIFIRCGRNGLRQSCRLLIYPDKDMPIIELYFGRNYLASWEEISMGTIALVKSFLRK